MQFKNKYKSENIINLIENYPKNIIIKLMEQPLKYEEILGLDDKEIEIQVNNMYKVLK